jgi:Antitoxin to bacterial toxin RNase LS or RnlA
MCEIQIDSIEDVCSIISIPGSAQVVVATSWINPMRIMGLIEKLMQANGFNGVVIFDLALVNGLATNRFAEIQFNGKFDRRSSKVISEDDLPENAGAEIRKFFVENPQIVEQSNILFNENKDLLLRS